MLYSSAAKCVFEKQKNVHITKLLSVDNRCNVFSYFRGKPDGSTGQRNFCFLAAIERQLHVYSSTDTAEYFFSRVIFEDCNFLLNFPYIMARKLNTLRTNRFPRLLYKTGYKHINLFLRISAFRCLDCNKFQKPLKFTTNIFIQAVNCFSTWFAHTAHFTASL